MQYNDDVQLDTSQVADSRGSRGGMLAGTGGRLAVGGGGLGIVGVIVAVVLSLAGGGGGTSAVTDVLGSLGQGNQPPVADNGAVAQECKTGRDANTTADCAVVADIDSIQQYWASEAPRLGVGYLAVPTVWFTGEVQTGCGAASSGSGPFYCPADKRVYIDLSFYNDIKTEFHATGGPFVNAYVLAHEYGHHVQDLLGVEAQVRAGQTGPTSASVRLELQADCYAGVWARHATEPDSNGNPPLVKSITAQDVASAIQVAGRIGDDWIQQNLGDGTVNQNAFTHGTSAQRQKWLSTGYRTGDPQQCDTFGAASLG